MIFHRSKFKTTGQDVVLQNSALTCVTTTKFLEVIIDHKFKWNDHITFLKSKISRSIGILYKILKKEEKLSLALKTKHTKPQFATNLETVVSPFCFNGTCDSFQD